MPNAADILVDTLIEQGVEVIFGLPGDGINGIMEALRTRQNRIRFVQVRHEESAAFMACGYAKWTGRLGVCLATSGPGGTNLLTGLYDAKLDQMPVLAITGMQHHDLIETFTQQDVDLTRVFADVAIFNAQVTDAAHMENVAALAARTAVVRRGVAHLMVANDIQEQQLEKAHRSRRNEPGHTGHGIFLDRRVPDQVNLDEAAEILNQAERVAILVGRGALGARNEVHVTAGLLAAPVAKALLGKGVLPDDHPHSMGGIGILGSRPSQDIMEQCDALLIVGSTFPYIEYYPKPGQARVVQIDIDPQRIGLRCPVEVGLVGDSALSLRELNNRLRRKGTTAFLDSAQAGMTVWREMMTEAEQRVSSPLKPQAIVRAFGTRMSEDAVLAADSGQNTELAARHIDLRQKQLFTVSGSLASMASALPYAIAAGIAFPKREICAVVGDGGFAMQLGEFSTAVRHCIRLRLLVIRNEMLNQIAWEQMMFLGNPQFACELQPIDFAKAAEAMGGRGLTIQQSGDIETILDQAFDVDGPVVVDARVDRYEPMLPPRMPADYAENLRKALPETPGKRSIETNLEREPLVTMMRG